MRTYEALYIVRPDISDDEVQTVATGVEQLITEAGGAIVRSETWGKRRLAYQVNKHQEGVYVLVRFQSDPAFIEGLENHFRLSEEVLRDLVVLFDEKTLRLEAEQQLRSEALLQARNERGPRRGGDRDDDDDGDDRPRRRPAPARSTPSERPARAPAAKAEPAPKAAEESTDSPSEPSEGSEPTVQAEAEPAPETVAETSDSPSDSSETPEPAVEA